MESLAYLELVLASEAPADSKICEGLKWKHLSSQTYIHLLSLALMLSVLSAASSAFAQIDPRYPNLRSVQDQLRELGYFNRSSTGQLGPVTQEALTNFQRDYQLSLTGRPDRDTVIALNSLAGLDTQPLRTSLTTSVTKYYTNYRELHFGDRGADVSSLQHRLQELGYFNTHPTGSFREVTLQALKAFQRVNRLRVTGVADSQTLALLFSSTAPIGPVTIPGNISGNGACKGLRFGDRGPTVDLIQRQLKVLGYFEGSVDGKFRERTLYAVTSFQQDYNLVSDGCADTATLIAIDSRLRAFVPTSPHFDRHDHESSRSGYTRRQVIALQRQLAELDYYNGSIDGVFDSEVRDALIRFQEDNSLPTTGKLDRNTQVTLKRVLAQRRTPQEFTLRRGDRIPAVPISSSSNSRSSILQLQRRLQDLGFYNGPLSGVFDAPTGAALDQAQRSYGVSSDDLFSQTF